MISHSVQYSKSMILKTFYIRTFGCQMNVADSEIVESILINNSYIKVNDIKSADIIIFNTCSVRDKAEQSLFKQIDQIKNTKKKKILIGILGCMAQRLKDELFKNENIDFVVGPDQYKQIPNIIDNICENYEGKIVETEFIQYEFYENITQNYSSSISAFIPIIRGCNNFCTYCIVPYTRGREKSRNIDSIVTEIKKLSKKNYKEVTLLGENVDSYSFSKDNKTYNFADLLKIISENVDNIRIRFTSSHPKDIDKNVLEVIKNNKNICKHVHLPVQSGSNKILKLMNRPYSIEEYIEKINMIRAIIPDCGITTDIMCGFCEETDEDHQQTLKLMEEIKFDYAFTFAYSERSGTYSAKFLKDNICKEIKIKRLNEIIKLQQIHSKYQNSKCINKTFEILVEGQAKRNKNEFLGRTTCNKCVIFDNTNKNVKLGDFINVKINKCTSATLFGEVK